MSKKYSYLLLFILLLSGISATTNGELLEQRKLIWGLDLSHHQNKINWDLLAQQKPSFIFFKATEGKSLVDDKYSQYRKEAKKLGILSGAYHFFSYASPGYWQAKNFLKVAQLQKGDLPPVLDIEWTRNNIMPHPKLIASQAAIWLKQVEEEMGVRPIIYCNYRFYTDYLEGKLAHEYPLWLSNYSRKPEYKCLFWQKTNAYTINGIHGKVDYNIFMGNASDLRNILIK